MKIITILSIFLAIACYSCKHQHASTTDLVNHDGHNHEEEGHDHEAEGPEHNHDHGAETHDEIIFSRTQAARTDFEVQEIHPREFQQVIKTTGQILPAPGDESIMVATHNGTVSFANSKVAPGSAARKGEILFYIASKNLGEGDYYAKTSAAYNRAKAEYERAQKLIKDHIISQKEYERIQLDYQNAKLAYDAIAGKQSGAGVGVSAPLSGYIKDITVRDGEYVTAGQALATVSQNKRLVLQAEVPERYYAQLPFIQSANFMTPYDKQTYALSDLGGRLISAGKTAGNSSFFIPVTFEFDNRGKIIPGTLAEIYLLAAPVPQTLTLPLTALTNEMGTYYVYVQLDEEGYRKQEVTPGISNGKEIQILAGLQAGDRVVTRGAYQVKMAANSGAIPHGHEH